MCRCILIIAVIIMGLLYSCQPVSKNISNNKQTPKQITYIYTGHDENNNPSDSLKVYDGLPFEASLELYAGIDSLNKTVPMLVHMGIFKVEGQKFAVITDTTATAFYKFEKGLYKKIFSSKSAIGYMIDPMQYKDYNADGYTDVLYSVPSGGSYGNDDFLLFYNPKSHTLIYNEEPQLRNTEIKGTIVTVNGSFWSKAYTIDKYSLTLLRDETIIQADTAYMRKEVITYDAKGHEISRDTIALTD